MNLLHPDGFLIRRLHSLTGVMPVGVFLINHFFANSYAIHGQEAYDGHAQFILGLPYLFVIEALTVFLPILFHGVLGVYIATRGQINLGTQRYVRNWMYVLQRVSGALLVAFIAVHVWHTRFNPAREPSLFALMQAHFQDPRFVAFYVLGILSATFHFANGLWGFLITWGVTLSPRSQRLSFYACAALFVAMSFVGINTVFAFNGSGITFLNPSYSH